MRQGVATRHKVFLGFARALLVENLHDARFELRHVGHVVGGDAVLARRSRQDHRVHGGAVVDLLVGQTEIEFDGGEWPRRRR